jgi:uncharacterized protein
MKKRCYIIHGWGGNPNEAWLPWLKNELEKNGFEVYVPEMPDTENPVIKKWVNKLSEVVNVPDEQTYFVGGSIGCQTIIRYIESIDYRVGGAVFVAGWFDLTNLEAGEIEIAQPWLETKINFEKVKQNLPTSTIVLSDDDPLVPFEITKEKFKKYLGSEVVEKTGKGHFDKESELPEALTAILKNSS